MIYLNNAATAARRPPCVAAAVLAALDGAGSAARGAGAGDLAAARTVAGARLALSELFSFDHPERVVFCANATQALNTAILGCVGAGERVVATDFDHNSVLRPIGALVRERGAEAAFAPVAPDGSIDLEDFERLVRPGTRLVVVPHASNLTGVVLPVARIARIAHAAGALLLVDAAQTAGAVPIDFHALGADLLAFTGHKALMGPQGTGGLVVGEGVQVRPLVSGGTGVQGALAHQPDTYPEHLEAGTLNTPGIAGLGAAARFLLDTGVEAVRAHDAELRGRFVAGARAIPGVTVYGLRDGMDHVATVALNVRGLDSARVADRLAEGFGIAVRAGLHCAPRAHAALGTLGQGAVRFSFGWYTDVSEVDAALEALALIAREPR